MLALFVGPSKSKASLVKVNYIAYQRSEVKRIEFMAALPPRSCQLIVGGKHISAIPVMTTRGIEDVHTTTKNVNGEEFVDFLIKYVLPIILPFDGNNPRSILILDNASIHHLDRISDIITGVGAKLCFLPPYSPDLMLLEEIFSKVKQFLRSNSNVYSATLAPEKWHLLQ